SFTNPPYSFFFAAFEPASIFGLAPMTVPSHQGHVVCFANAILDSGRTRLSGSRSGALFRSSFALGGTWITCAPFHGAAFHWLKGSVWWSTNAKNESMPLFGKSLFLSRRATSFIATCATNVNG